MMENPILFFHMFPDYEPPEALRAALSQAAIAAADLDPENRRVAVAVLLVNRSSLMVLMQLS